MKRKVDTKNHLLAIMLKDGWSDRTLSIATGISPSFIYKLKMNQVGASVGTAAILCSVLKVKIEDLFIVEEREHYVPPGQTDPIGEGSADVGDPQNPDAKRQLQPGLGGDRSSEEGRP